MLQKSSALSENQSMNKMLLDQLQKLNDKINEIDKKSIHTEAEKLNQLLEMQKQNSVGHGPQTDKSISSKNSKKELKPL